MALEKKDFIEIEFIGKLKDGGVFDTNIKEVAKENNLDLPTKSFVFSLGNDMFLKGVDEFLIGKEVGKTYEIELSPEKAFGKRQNELVKLMPSNVFRKHNINPFPGAVFNFDGQMAKILSVSGGRVRVDFNNPLAGKDLVYTIKVLGKVDDKSKQTKAFIEFLFRREFPFEINDKKLVIEFEDPNFKQFAEIFKDKFKEVLDLELETKIKEKSKKESTEKSQ